MAATDLTQRIKTIRGWFFAAAILGVWFDLRPVFMQADLPADVIAAVAVRALLLLAYVMAAIRMEHFLKNGAYIPKGIVLANVAYRTAINAWYNGAEGFQGPSLTQVILNLALNVVLWSLIATTARDLSQSAPATTLTE